MDKIKYKHDIVEALNIELIKVYSEISTEHVDIIKYDFTKTGLYIDFDLPSSITPNIFNELRDRMNNYAISCFFELSNFSGICTDDIESQKESLQRIYIIAFETLEEFDEYKEHLKLSAEHDHKKIGNEMQLYSSSEMEYIKPELELGVPQYIFEE